MDLIKGGRWGPLRKEGAPMIYIWLLFGLWSHNPMLVTVVDVVAVFSVYVLPVCLNAVPAPVKRRCFAHFPKKVSSQNHIPFSRSFSCNRRLGNKKAGTKTCTDHPKKDRFLPLRVWYHIHVTGFQIQSRNCPLRLSVADSS